MQSKIKQQNHLSKYFLTLSTLAFFSPAAMALPIDWQGSFGVDSSLIQNYRKTDLTGSGTTGAHGNKFIAPAPGNPKKLSFQSYLFKLSPTIIVNDSISIRGEMTTGYAHSGFFGDSSAHKKGNQPHFGNALYHYNTTHGDPNLSLTQLYMELFSDTATYTVGRHSVNWGLGALYNSGQGWDRHASIQDGVSAKFKIANFQLIPYWAQINSTGNMTNLTNTKTYGASFLYDNVQRDINFGILLGRKKSEANNTFYQSDTTNAPLGRVKVKILDLFFKKAFGKFNFGVEFPYLSGDLGDVYAQSNNTKYKAQAILFESNYELNNSWKLGFDAGQVSGDKGPGGNFEAMYLHPNYQKALLLYRYNWAAVTDPTQSIYDSYIVNTKYLKFSTQYINDAWTWKGAMIYGVANEVAKPNQAFDHELNKAITPSFKQEKDLGFEIDFGLDYKWTSNFTISSELGYLFVGDYYAFNNTANPIKLKDPYIAQVKALINF